MAGLIPTDWLFWFAPVFSIEQLYALTFIMGTFFIATWSDLKHMSAQSEFLYGWVFIGLVVLNIEIWVMYRDGMDLWRHVIPFAVKWVLIAVLCTLSHARVGVIFDLASGDVAAIACTAAWMSPFLVILLFVLLKLIDLAERPALRKFGSGEAYPFMPVVFTATGVLLIIGIWLSPEVDVITQLVELSILFVLGTFFIATWSDIKHMSAQSEFLSGWVFIAIVFLNMDLIRFFIEGADLTWDGLAFSVKWMLVAVLCTLSHARVGVLFKLASGDVAAIACACSILPWPLVLLFFIFLKLFDWMEAPGLKKVGSGEAYPFMPVVFSATLVTLLIYLWRFQIMEAISGALGIPGL